MAIDPTRAAASAIGRLSVQRAAASALAGAPATGNDLSSLFSAPTATPRFDPALPSRIANAASGVFQGARDLRETAGAFGAEDAFEQRTVESERRAVSGTAANGAEIGEFEVEVVERAAGQRNNGTRLDPTQNSDIATGTNTVAIDIDGETRIVSFDVGATDNNREALQSFADAINEADTGVTAEVRETANGEVRIRTTRDDTGAEATFDIRDLQGDAVAATGADIERRAARDAEVIVDGQTVTSATNTIELDGGNVTLQINRTTNAPVTVGVVADTEAQTEFVQDFVTEFNDFRTFLNENADLISQEIGGDLDAAVRAQGSELAAVGITRAADGSLEIDEERLAEVMAEDPDRVEDLFTNFNGLATRVGAVADRVATTAPSRFVADSQAFSLVAGDGGGGFTSSGTADNPLLAALNSGQLIDLFS